MPDGDGFNLGGGKGGDEKSKKKKQLYLLLGVGAVALFVLLRGKQSGGSAGEPTTVDQSGSGGNGDGGSGGADNAAFLAALSQQNQDFLQALMGQLQGLTPPSGPPGTGAGFEPPPNAGLPVDYGSSDALPNPQPAVSPVGGAERDVLHQVKNAIRTPTYNPFAVNPFSAVHPDQANVKSPIAPPRAAPKEIARVSANMAPAGNISQASAKDTGKANPREISLPKSIPAASKPNLAVPAALAPKPVTRGGSGLAPAGYGNNRR